MSEWKGRKVDKENGRGSLAEAVVEESKTPKTL